MLSGIAHDSVLVSPVRVWFPLTIENEEAKRGRFKSMVLFGTEFLPARLTDGFKSKGELHSQNGLMPRDLSDGCS
jgi:hypothetical protein